MTALALVLGAAVAVAAVLLVALPFLREPRAVDDRLDVTTAESERRLLLVEERDRALAALKELEFDHRTGKIGAADYGELVGPLRRSAAAALRALDGWGEGAAGRAEDVSESPTPVTEPSPPPDEGTPPTPAPVPEPYPPPDEATPAAPARVPEPAPPQE